MVRSSFAYGAFILLLFAIMTVLYLHIRPRCSDQIVSDTNSPEGRWAASVMEARCGEDQPFLTHVNLRPANVPLKLGYFSGRGDQGEIFLVEQDAQSAGVTLNWSAPSQLVVTCAHCQATYVRTRMERWGEVTISYVLTGQ